MLDAHNRINVFDLSEINPVSFTSGVVKFADVNGFPTSVYSGDWNNFGPQFGVAWLPSGNTVHSIVEVAQYNPAEPPHWIVHTLARFLLNFLQLLFAPACRLSAKPKGAERHELTNQPFSDRIQNYFGRIMDIQFLHQVGSVAFNGVGANVEEYRDVFVRFSFSH
jgi:hypothetical protein